MVCESWCVTFKNSVDYEAFMKKIEQLRQQYEEIKAVREDILEVQMQRHRLVLLIMTIFLIASAIFLVVISF
jgi:hypothetical protein